MLVYISSYVNLSLLLAAKVQLNNYTCVSVHLYITVHSAVQDCTLCFTLLYIIVHSFVQDCTWGKNLCINVKYCTVLVLMHYAHALLCMTALNSVVHIFTLYSPCPLQIHLISDKIYNKIHCYIKLDFDYWLFNCPQYINLRNSMTT